MTLTDQIPLSVSVQDYLKAIHGLERRDERSVTTNALADRLAVTPGSVSAMLKRLAAFDLVTYEPYRGARLTANGARVALEVIRRHRLLETYLAEELGMPWDRVHAEAEILEHVLSSELEALIAAKLGHPTRDPHGDPIPNADLELEEPDTVRLSELETGARGTFTRVSDSDPQMLRFLAERGISPGATVEVTERQPFGGPTFVRVGDEIHPLGQMLAEAMRVEKSSPGQESPAPCIVR
jgi:DtxR family transcriptional regulator, Mn-dependent transcriptional regulator